VQEYDVVVVGGGPAGCSTAINCSMLGMSVLLLEKDKPGRHKPCGGVLPWITAEVIEDILGLELSTHVMEEPAELGLFYVPPSGRKKSGRVPNYKIHNIDRDKFDAWLLKVVDASNVDVLTDTRFTNVTDSEIHSVRGDESIHVKYKYLVGADGVRSTVRQLLTHEQVGVLLVGQELWSCTYDGDLSDCFSGFFRGDLSIAYAYTVPKGEDLLIGIGVQPKSSPNVAEAMKLFKNWLTDDFSFEEKQIRTKETWAIPFGFFVPGAKNTILVGDAAGICNPLSGEGIRLGIESGESAASAISRAETGADLQLSYSTEIGGLANMVKDIHDFVLSLDDKGREQFVSEELARGVV